MAEPELGSCQVLLVRHGQSQALVEGQPFPLVDGHGDPPLSELGLWQADRVGERLAKEPVDAIYVSSLTRTHQTAAPTGKAHNIAPVVEPDFREVFLGDYEGGMFRIRAAENHSTVAAMRDNQEWGELPGAETNTELQSRVVGALKRVAAKHTDELVAVFCHGGVVASLLGYAHGRSDFAFMGVRNASFSLLQISPQGWTIRSFNDTTHCGSLTADADPPT